MSDDHDGEAMAEGSVDPAPLHDAVEALAVALHAYVDQAVGVRAEFSAEEADEDPRVRASESRIGMLNAALFDALHSTLGIHADLTSSVWETDERPAPPGSAEAFYLGFVVAADAGFPDADLDGALDVLDAAGTDVVERLADAGFDVTQWSTSRGRPDGFGDGEFEGDEDTDGEDER